MTNRACSFVIWLSLLVTAAVTMGCNTSDPDIAGAGIGGGKGKTDPCASPNLGCSCSNPGEKVDCGKVVQSSGSYVTCSEGSRTCNGGTWGDCIGEYTTTRDVSASSLNLQGLGASAPCNDDPCDPSCLAFTNDPSGITFGPDSGLTLDDGGLELTGTPVPVTSCTAIQVTPNTAPAKDLTVTTMAPSPNSVQYTASVLPAGCFAGTPTFLWSIDKYDVAQISSTGQLVLAVPIAGPINVSAYAGTLSASVTCNVTINVVDTSNAPTGFTNAQFPTTTGAADNIQVLYPYPGTVFPLGLPAPLIQWQDNNLPVVNADAVKVTLRFPATGTPIFSWSEIENELQAAPTPTLAGKPRAQIPQDVWSDFEQSVVRNSGAGGGDAVFAIQRVVAGTLRTEQATTFHFANGQLKGSIFYNSYGTNLVHNFGYSRNGQPFGAATLQVAANGTSPTVVVGYNDPSLSGGGCRVCHNAAAGGTRILSNSYLSNGSFGGGSTEATSWTYNPTLGSPAAIQGSETLVGTSYGSNVFTYAALSPDGTYLMTSAAPQSAGGSARLYSIDGTPVTSNMPANLHAATPAFSADATAVAFNFYSGDASPLSGSSADGKSLAMMNFTPPNTFSNFRTLYTPSALYSVWPSFLPPGQGGIVFQNEVTANGRDWAGTRSTCDGSGGCNDTGATGELWWVSTGATPQANVLANLNGGSYMPRSPGGANYHGSSTDNGTYYEEVYNYEPAALPVSIGGYSWVAFTSRRLYGNVATLDPYWSDPRYQDISTQPTTKKIWIAAISNNPTPGTDPSFPAFYLPGQELLAGNSRAYFTLAACETPGAPTDANLCTSNLDCCGADASPPTAACQLDQPLSNPPTSHCVSTGGATCVADGGSCTSDAQCCSFGAGYRCGSGVCGPAPPILTYNPATYTTTYQSVCPAETAPIWRFFYWTSVTPAGTSIAFTAKTSNDGVSWSAQVPVGTSSPPPVTTATWTSGATTVDDALRASGQISQKQLLVTATLNPNASQTSTPTLTGWRVTYDCLASE